ncbi:uncharacterized protein LOC115749146 [Rhodamnia argentea]|uniref:Uncharacterized protein LOC115749146 n=1 Tax=Rhodamnia argentea TaxID=178133 RepID=A0A8B8Q3N3_9MYRT|nr:uncharacterized protein LOC115749146 [Rhodamnia argentea]
MEEVRKRQADEAADGGEEGSPVKKPKTTETRAGPDSADDDDDDDDCISAWLTLDDDAVSELLDLLEPAGSSPSSSSSSAAAAGGAAFNFKVKFIDDPYASQLVFQASSSFVTINGNEESCGSSFSESETTVMASIDTRGIGALRGAGDEAGRGRRVAEWGGAWGAGSGEARGCGMEGCDCGFGADDDVVAGFLGEQGGEEEEEEMLLTGLK